MNIHNPSPDRLDSVRLDLARDRRALATNCTIYSMRHLPEAEALLRQCSSGLPLAAARRLSATLPGAHGWNPMMRRDVRDVLRGLASAARAMPGAEARARAAWLRDRLREIEAQNLRVETLDHLLRLTGRTRRACFPAPRR